MEIIIVGATIFEKSNKKDKIIVGGIEGYINDLIDFMLERNIKIRFVGKIFNYYPKKNLSYNPVCKNEFSSTANFLVNLLLKRDKTNNNILVHAHRPDHLFVYSLFRRQKSILTLHGQHNIMVKSRKNILFFKLFNFMEKSALKKAERIIAVDHITNNFYLSEYPWIKNKLLLLPTGVNLNKFKSMDKKRIKLKYGYKLKDKIILFVGRLKKVKRVDKIIDTISNIKDLNVKLLIFGNGPEEKSLKNKAQLLNLKNQVIFHNAVPRDKVTEILNLGDVLVLFSRYEGSPLIVKEALACGTPVVSNNVGDIPNVIKNDINGYIVQKDNINLLSRYIEKGLKNSEKMRENCIESVKKYSTDIIFNKLYEIYQELNNNE